MLGSTRAKEETVYGLSVSHTKMDDDYVISLISTSRLRNLDSSSHCVTTPLPSFLNLSTCSLIFTPYFHSRPNPHYLISEGIISVSQLGHLSLDVPSELCSYLLTLIAPQVSVLTVAHAMRCTLHEVYLLSPPTL